MDSEEQNKTRIDRHFKKFGHKMTKGRELTMRILAETDKHLSAEDVYLKVHAINNSVGLTSIYRTLEILVNMGVVSKFDFGDGRARYEMVEGYKNSKHHHHLICTSCGRIIDYSDFLKEEKAFFKKIEGPLSKKHNFRITNHLVQFYGLCDRC